LFWLLFGLYFLLSIGGAVNARETIAADASIVTRSAHFLVVGNRFGSCDPLWSGRSEVARSSSAASHRSASV
jgi:hypothetical protein